MSKRNIIRVNDRVKIVNPKIILRWGYTLTKQIAKDTLVTQEQKDSIHAMLMKFRGATPTDILFRGCDDVAYDKVLDLMAYEILKKNSFGGPERKLFTLNRDSLRGKTGYVSKRKVVKTGTHYSGGGCQHWTDYGQEYDYEPPGLADEETHVLFMIRLNWCEDLCPNILNEGVWIEKVNLEKII